MPAAKLSLKLTCLLKLIEPLLYTTPLLYSFAPPVFSAKETSELNVIVPTLLITLPNIWLVEEFTLFS